MGRLSNFVKIRDNISKQIQKYGLRKAKLCYNSVKFSSASRIRNNPTIDLNFETRRALTIKVKLNRLFSLDELLVLL